MEKYLIKNNSVPKIYVYHTSFLGDILISYYFLAELKALNPDSKIVFITTPINVEITSRIDCIDQVIKFDKRSAEVKKNTQNLICEIERNSIFINLHPSIRSYLITWKAKSIYKIVYANNTLSFLFKRKVKYKFHLHERYRLFEFLKYFDNYKISEVSPKYEILDGSKSDNSNEILIFPGSVWGTKRWNKDYFVEVAKYLKSKKFSVKIAGSKGEKQLCEFIAGQSDTTDISGEFPLDIILEKVSQARLIICNDSSPTHMADFFKTPVLTIFGSTSPNFGFYPISGDFIKLDSLKCSPCNIHGPQQCPIGTHACMNELDPEMVINKIEEILNR